MCFALLQISYKNEKKKDVTTAADEADERTKIDDIMGRDQVSKVEVFRAHRIVKKKEVHEEIPYKAPLVEA